MKIIQFVPTLESGGVEKGVLEIANALVRNNHDSHVVSAGGRLVQNLTENGSTHHHWNLHIKSLLTFRLVLPLRKWIISMNADILHIRSRMPAWIVWMAWQGIPKKNRPKLISTVHGLHSVNFYSAIMTKPNNIIAVSNASKQYIYNNYTKDSKKNIQVIYRGVDDSEYFMNFKASKEWISKWHKDFPETKGCKLLTIAGRISPLKDFEKILQLGSNIKKQTSRPFKILIAGEAKDRHKKYLKKLKLKIIELEISNEVIFLNYRNDIKEIYSISSLVFNTSNKPESFGRSILEPLSIGVPSIGYNRGGVKEILNELYPYGAIEFNDDKELLNKTLNILNGNNLNINTNKKFLTSEMCNQTLDFYKNTLSC
jgi:glycosyltransferase involved in cell wall biosynthesis